MYCVPPAFARGLLRRALHFTLKLPVRPFRPSRRGSCGCSCLACCFTVPAAQRGPPNLSSAPVELPSMSANGAPSSARLSTSLATRCDGSPSRTRKHERTVLFASRMFPWRRVTRPRLTSFVSRPAARSKCMSPSRRMFCHGSRKCPFPPASLLVNLRRSRRGAAAGPSGHTAKITRLLLGDANAASALVDVANQLAQGRVPPLQPRWG